MITVTKDMFDHRRLSLQNDPQIKVSLIIENFDYKIINIIKRDILSSTIFFVKQFLEPKLTQ
jgi:hypothetical protein